MKGVDGEGGISSIFSFHTADTFFLRPYTKLTLQSVTLKVVLHLSIQY